MDRLRNSFSFHHWSSGEVIGLDKKFVDLGRCDDSDSFVHRESRLLAYLDWYVKDVIGCTSGEAKVPICRFLTDSRYPSLRSRAEVLLQPHHLAVVVIK